MFWRETRGDARGTGFSARLVFDRRDGFNEQPVPTPTDATDPAWSPLGDVRIWRDGAACDAILLPRTCRSDGIAGKKHLHAGVRYGRILSYISGPGTLSREPMSDIAITRTSAPKTPPSDDSLTFGNVFTDHMFLMNYEDGKGWHDPTDRAVRAVLARSGVLRAALRAGHFRRIEGVSRPGRACAAVPACRITRGG